MKTRLGLVPLSVFTMMLSAIAAQGQSPADADCLLEPTFVMRDGSESSAGKAWCAKLKDGRSVVVTALHLLGPDGGQPKQIPASQVGSSLARVDLFTAGSQRRSSTNKVLSRTGYTLNEQTMDCSGDVVYFEAPTSLVPKAFTLATQPAKPREPVWLFTKLAGATAPRLYPGVVVVSTPTMLQVKLSKPCALRATSGSPVIDKTGKVVGQLSAGDDELGIVICNPGSAINSRIAKDTHIQ